MQTLQGGAKLEIAVVKLPVTPWIFLLHSHKCYHWNILWKCRTEKPTMNCFSQSSTYTHSHTPRQGLHYARQLFHSLHWSLLRSRTLQLLFFEALCDPLSQRGLFWLLLSAPRWWKDALKIAWNHILQWGSGGWDECVFIWVWSTFCTKDVFLMALHTSVCFVFITFSPSGLSNTLENTTHGFGCTKQWVRPCGPRVSFPGIY